MTDTLSISLAPSQSEKFRTRVLPFLIMAAVLVVIPLTGPSRTTYSLLNAIGINMVFALSYNMLLGRAGLLSFGHAVYFGLGGYAAMHAMQAIETGTGPLEHVPGLCPAAGRICGRRPCRGCHRLAFVPACRDSLRDDLARPCRTGGSCRLHVHQPLWRRGGRLR